MNIETKSLPRHAAADPSAEAHPAWEWSGLAVLAVTVVWLVAISWRKWGEPLIDFGRDIYLAWRLTEGAVLYRDMDANYGPLSHFFNALVFDVTGVGWIHLVWVNLLIYLVILMLLYRGLRIGWGRVAAFAGSLAFVLVFSFSQYGFNGNYNYLAPYAHECTHGILLVLVLINVLASWLKNPRQWKVVTAGFCCGLCALLKVEILFAAVLVIFGALAIAWFTAKEMRRIQPWLPIAGSFLGACAVPPLLATLFLWQDFPLATAFTWANIGWMGLLIYKGIASDPLQLQTMGLDDIPTNFASVLIYGCASLAAAFGLPAICQRIKSFQGVSALGLALPIATGLAAYWLPWIQWAITYPAWLCMILVVALREKLPADRNAEPAVVQSAGIRWLFLIAAVGLLARMCLNPRLYHYGFYQAVLSGVIVVAVGFRTLPDLFVLRGLSRNLYLASLGAFFAVGFWTLQEHSQLLLSIRTQAIGEGADQFYGTALKYDPTATLLEETRKVMATKTDCQSLLVMPEGITLNYLLRKPDPISAYNFNSYWLHWQDQMLAGLKKNPPDYVVLITRDMREYGMYRLGDSPEHGAAMMAWIAANYRAIWQAGGDPLDVATRGAAILQKVAKAPDR